MFDKNKDSPAEQNWGVDLEARDYLAEFKAKKKKTDSNKCEEVK